MFALFPLLIDVTLRRVEEGTFPVGDSRERCLHFEGEGSEISNVNSSALHDMFFEVFNSGFPDQHHLAERL